jgi:hypothetical protein
MVAFMATAAEKLKMNLETGVEISTNTVVSPDSYPEFIKKAPSKRMRKKRERNAKEI